MPFAVRTAARVRAWELGAGSEMEKEMLRCGKIVAHPGGVFEVFSQEATEGRGQMAEAGDFFKVDDQGCIHPNRRAFFLENHQHLEGEWYLQAARPLKIWRLGDPDCEEIRFLLDTGALSVHPENRERCFFARLWGTTETAAADAVIVFYYVEKDPKGKVCAVDFNFVEAVYFNTHYEVIQS